MTYMKREVDRFDHGYNSKYRWHKDITAQDAPLTDPKVEQPGERVVSQ